MKKLLVLAVCLMLAGMISVNGTFAFSISDLIQQVTDLFGEPTQATKAELNVETLIQMRNGNELVSDRGQMLIPANMPDSFDWESAKQRTVVEGKEYSLWIFSGAVDKFISVKNNTTGSDEAEDEAKSAYFRTAISIRCEDDEVWKKLKLNLNNDDFDWDLTEWTVTGDGKYRTNIATYKKELAPGETSPAMMMQIALDKSMTNEQMTKFGSEFRIEIDTVAIDKAAFVKTIEGQQVLMTESEVQEVLKEELPLNSFLNN